MNREEAVTEIATTMKKAGLVWLTWGGRRPAPAWFATVDGQYVVLADADGSAEQPLPGLATAGTAEVVVPAKPATNRLASWKATVRRLQPGTEEWTAAALVLRTERLNAAGLDTQLERWRSEADILVLEPTGEITGFDGASPYETPTGTPATTRGRKPMTLHRRVSRRRKLS
ncbi:hypothetical protein GCM10029976_081480 [Kribbella albertanoniae]|uniref:Pyridoxamine 5'-phosphate oxidase putative domain-containing protein n=1 Tax=Kribbella albertanoniae TaxID=1266829 RepID=A0A4R4Q5L1_9ACTN|nr:hypothetical protein [Kribbella albertanoniae]TDC30388.1 hypothetical protein E1261_13385 [Kribbella albertanoniae]